MEGFVLWEKQGFLCCLRTLLLLLYGIFDILLSRNKIEEGSLCDGDDAGSFDIELGEGYVC
jgi:hypothetical protein